jgi:hypothetical protein
MNIVLLRLSSFDVDPNVGGMPGDRNNFRVQVEAMLAPAGREGDDVTFAFTVVSPSQLLEAPDGFITDTLVIPIFSWNDIRRRVDRLLMQVRSCTTWECVAYRLAGHMRPLGVTFGAL